MAGEEMQKNNEKPIDSLIYFKDFLEEKKDSIAQLSEEQQAKLKKLEPFMLHMVMNPEEKVMKFDLSSEFKQISEVNDAFNTFQEASALGPKSSSDQPAPAPMESQATEVNYDFKNGVFKRTAVVLDQELFQQSLDSLQGADMFLSGSTYTLKYHFPRRVKTASIEEATYSADGKTLIYEVKFLDFDERSVNAGPSGGVGRLVSLNCASYLCWMNKKVQLQDLGFKDYKETWDLQETLFKQIVDLKIKNRREETNLDTPNHFLFVEHPHVYTLGKSGDMTNLLVDEQVLQEKGATFYKINRGGDITYHGPGQVVGYPILDLDNFFTDIHKYLRFLEEMVILTLAEYGLKAERSEGETGVWLDVGTPFARKICAMGVRASRWVTMHGFALNVNSDLGYFDLMIPCGIKDKAVTSLNVELGKKEVDMDEVKQKLTHHFKSLFEAEVILPKTVV